MALRQEEFTSLCDDVDLDRDRVLVERCQAGDSGAFGNLYARYYERLLRFCLRRLNDRHEAEDAAQEAFARAWKALPNFAGERRFYPWLTVIAGNICTDMLRRRSRSTPTDDLELSAQQQVGGSGNETSEELVLAAVDGELVTKALARLSDRHQHVLAMREGSGWTYQQIADHEGVEIGTIETLLWRARQALKREFTVLSESKGILGGFLAGAGALLRRGFLRLAHKSASLQQSGGGTGGFRNAVAGVALTSVAVAAALITPHALSGSGAGGSTPVPVASASNVASPLSLAQSAPLINGSGTTAVGTNRTGGAQLAGGSSQSSNSNVLSIADGGSGSLSGDLSKGTGTSNITNTLGGGTSATVNGLGKTASGAVGTLTQTAGSAVGSLANTANGAVTSLSNGLNNLLAPLAPVVAPVLAPVQAIVNTPPPASAGTTTTSTIPVVGGALNDVAPTLNDVLGGL